MAALMEQRTQRRESADAARQGAMCLSHTKVASPSADQHHRTFTVVRSSPAYAELEALPGATADSHTQNTPLLRRPEICTPSPSETNMQPSAMN
jgi:hypothetical protein